MSIQGGAAGLGRRARARGARGAGRAGTTCPPAATAPPRARAPPPPAVHTTQHMALSIHPTHTETKYTQKQRTTVILGIQPRTVREFLMKRKGVKAWQRTDVTGVVYMGGGSLIIKWSVCLSATDHIK